MSDQPASPDATPQPTPLDASLVKPAIVPTPTTDEVAEPKKGRRPLEDPRAEQFARHYVSNLGDATDAARKVGVSEASAHTVGWRLKERESVRDRIAFLADKAGITVDRVLRNVERNLEAEDGANMRWANDRALEFHGVRGHSEQPKTVNNVGFIGLDQENMDRLAQTLLEKLNPQQDKS